MSEDRQDPAVDELQARLLARRAELGVGREGSFTSNAADAGPTTRKVLVKCAECGESWGWVQIRPAGTNRWGPPVPESPRCADCADEAKAAVRREQRELAEQEERARRERVRASRAEGILDLLDAAGVNTADHGTATLENFDASGCGYGPVDAVRRLLTETRRASRHTPVRGVYLVGDTGSGKSHLAVALYRELLLDPDFRPEEIVYDVSLELIGEIQDTYTSHASAKAVLAKRKNARLWVLDDFGTENPSNDVVRRLTEIFTARAKRPTLVTSNVDPNELPEKHRDFFRLFSRLGAEYFDVVYVAGRDRRMGEAAA